MKLRLQKIVMIILGLGIVGMIAYGFRPQPVPVDLAKVTRGSLRVTVDEDGKTRVRQRYVVAAPVAGQVQRIDWREGDAVLANKTLLAVIEPQESALLDPSAELQARARVKEAEKTKIKMQAMLDRAQSAHRDAELALERLETLRGTSAFIEEDWDVAIQREKIAAAEVRAANLDIQIAEFQVKQAEAVLERTRKSSTGEAIPRMEIYSPINGQVLRVFQESERAVTAGFQLLEVGDISDLEVEIDVLSMDAVKIRKAMVQDVNGHSPRRVFAELVHWGGEKPLNAYVHVVGPSGYMKRSALGVEEQRVDVVLRLSDPPEARASLGDGYRVEARIVIWESPDVVKVPAGALFRHQEEWAVFVVEQGVAQLRTVKVGKSNGLETEILANLDEGQEVILHPSDQIKPGVAVVPR